MLRIIEILIGLAMITCAIYLGVGTYKNHWRKKPDNTALDAHSDNSE